MDAILSKAEKSDLLGASVSTLCLVHCMLTPVLFAVQATSLRCADISPWWWRTIDYIFLFKAFWAIRHTVETTSLSWMPAALYATWLFLALIFINESFHFVHLSHWVLYATGATLAGLHLYNRRYCRCHGDRCCATKN